MPSIAQRRFTSGEIAPAYYPGVDLAKYAAACRVIENMLVKRTGGLDNRPGTQLIGELPFSLTLGRLIPFIFSDDQSYQLYFTDKKVFFARNGAFIAGQFAPGLAVSAITKANPGVVTVAGSVAENDIVQFAVNGMTELNGKTYMAKNVSGSTFEIWSPDGLTKINTTSFTTFSAGGSYLNTYLAYASPYAAADLADLQYVQSADTIIFTHKNYPQQQLKRTSDTVWTFSQMSFTIQTASPAITGLTTQNSDPSGGPSNLGPYGYCVTAVDATTLEESLPSVAWYIGNDVSATSGRFNNLTWSAVSNVKHYKLYKTNSHGGSLGFISFVTGTSYSDSSPGAVPDYTNTPPVQKDPFNTTATITNVVITNNHLLTITAAAHGLGNGQTVLVSGVVGTGAMSTVNGVAGTVAVVDANTFTLTASGTPYSTAPYTYTSGGTAATQDLWPAAVGYYQERLGFANQKFDPIGGFFSRSGLYKNFSTSTPVKDDDAVSFDVVSREVQEIRHLVDAGTLVILTAGSEHVAHGDISGVLKPTAINRKQHSRIGSSRVRPLMIGDSLVFLQKEQAKIYDLGIDINFGTVTVKPRELSLLFTHLTEGYKLTDWCYQQNPHSIIWARRSDGQLIGVTYLKEQEVIAGHHHTIGDGVLDAIENVSSCPEGDGDWSVYLVTKRTINGTAHRFLERFYRRSSWVNYPLTSKNWALSSASFLDCSLTYDGRNQDGTLSIGVSGGSTWDFTDTVTLTASSALFVAGDVGKYIFILAADGTVARFKITAYTSSTVVSAQPQKTVPVSMRSGSTWQWAKAITQITNLYHLEGKNVGIVGDGFVIGSPNNSNYPTFTVASGAVTLPAPYAVVQAGLPFISTMQTLDIDTAQGETVAGKKKLIDELVLFLENTRGGYYGSGEVPAAATPLTGLVEMPGDSDADDETPPALMTEVKNIQVQSDWNYNGRAVVRQVDPLPITLNGIVPSGAVPFGQGA